MQEIKKLYRSGTNRVIAGVCGGLGEYFEIDPVFVRAVFVFLALASGMGILLYIVLAIVLPQDPNNVVTSSTTGSSNNSSHQPNPTTTSVNTRRSNNVFGVIILCLGVFFILQVLFPPFFHHMNGRFIFSVGLIVLGVYMIARRDTK